MFGSEFPFVVEPMRSIDVPQVMVIERESFPLPWPERAYHHELTQNPNSHYVVLRPRHETGPGGWRGWLGQLANRKPRSPVIGYGGAWMIAGEVHISTIAVASGWRRRGLGELLLWSMLEHARSMGALEAMLEVRVSNRIAQNLYQKYGFEKVERRRRYYQDNGEDAWIMAVPAFDEDAYQKRLDQLGAALSRRLIYDAQKSLSGQSAVLGL